MKGQGFDNTSSRTLPTVSIQASAWRLFSLSDVGVVQGVKHWKLVLQDVEHGVKVAKSTASRRRRVWLTLYWHARTKYALAPATAHTVRSGLVSRQYKH
eukprot:scaffold620_cov386-Prasinococcus_capsulatus_cf.AAC.6